MPSIATMSISRLQHQHKIQLLNKLEPLMHQPVQTYKGNGGSYVHDGDKKIRLTGSRNASATIAGKVYWEQLLGVSVPIRYDYNQSLEQDK